MKGKEKEYYVSLVVDDRVRKKIRKRESKKCDQSYNKKENLF